MSTAAEMPRYRSHKTVWALEIKSITASPPGGWTVTPVDQGYGDVVLSAKVFARYMPVAGDFIVQYDDGYWSVSPRKAFIEGYTPITDDTIANRAANATGWIDQRSQPDHEVQELRRWALGMANDGRSSDAAITAAAQFEAYVLNGAPAKKEPGDDQ